VDIGGDGRKCQRAVSRPGSAHIGSPGTSGAMLEITRHPAGTVTVNSKVALRSGWSKQA